METRPWMILSSLAQTRRARIAVCRWSPHSRRSLSHLKDTVRSWPRSSRAWERSATSARASVARSVFFSFFSQASETRRDETRARARAGGGRRPRDEAGVSSVWTLAGPPHKRRFLSLEATDSADAAAPSPAQRVSVSQKTPLFLNPSRTRAVQAPLSLSLSYHAPLTSLSLCSSMLGLLRRGVRSAAFARLVARLVGTRAARARVDARRFRPGLSLSHTHSVTGETSRSLHAG